MHESCSINEIKSDYVIALYSVTSVFGNVEFTVSNKLIVAFEFRVWDIVLLKANTLKIAGWFFFF